MEKEISSAVEITVALIGLAAFLAVVLFTVHLGWDIKDDAGVFASDVRDDLTTNALLRFSSGEYDNEMPTATAYSILKRYDNVIAEYACGIDGRIVNPLIEEPCLRDHLHGRVQLEVHDVYGTLVAFIHEEDCNWKVSDCTCRYKDVISNLKAKYGIQ